MNMDIAGPRKGAQVRDHFRRGRTCLKPVTSTKSSGTMIMFMTKWIRVDCPFARRSRTGPDPRLGEFSTAAQILANPNTGLVDRSTCND